MITKEEAIAPFSILLTILVFLKVPLKQYNKSPLFIFPLPNNV